MPRTLTNALSPGKIKGLPVGTHSDGAGLTLRVGDNGSRRWVLRMRVDGKPTNLGLGVFPAVSLAEARKLAVERRSRPVTDKRPAAPPPPAPTFAEVAERVIELRRPSWTPKHAAQWVATLQTHAYPFIGHLRVDAITTDHVMAALEEVWSKKPATAGRLRQRIEAVLSYSKVRGFRSGDNPAGRELLAVLPKAKQTTHHKALPYGEVAAAIRTIGSSSSHVFTKYALEFLILTATRSGEVRGATWDEVDWESATWTIPAARMKARREHKVPLSQQAAKVLWHAWLMGGGFNARLLFPSPRKATLACSSLTAALARNGIDCVVHGFRSSFRDWAAEKSGAPWAVCETALAHNVGSSVEASYMRSDLFEQRRKLMQDWSDFLTNEPSVGEAGYARPWGLARAG